MSERYKRINRNFLRNSTIIVGSLGLAGIIATGCSESSRPHFSQSVLNQPTNPSGNNNGNTGGNTGSGGNTGGGNNGGSNGGSGGSGGTPAPVAGTATLEFLINRQDLTVAQTQTVASPAIGVQSVAPGATGNMDPVRGNPASGASVLVVPRGTAVTRMDGIAGIASGTLTDTGHLKLTNVPTTDQGTDMDAYIDLDGNNIPDAVIGITASNGQNNHNNATIRPRPQASGLNLGVNLSNNAPNIGDIIDCTYAGSNSTGTDVSATIDLVNQDSGIVQTSRAVTIPQGSFNLSEAFDTATLPAANYALRIRAQTTPQGMILSEDSRLEVEVTKVSNHMATLYLVSPTTEELVNAGASESLNSEIALRDKYKAGSPLNFRIDVTDGSTTRKHFVFGSGYTGTDASGTPVTNAQFAHVTQTGTDEWYVRMSTADGANTNFSGLSTQGDLEFIIRKKSGNGNSSQGEEFAINFTLAASGAGSDKHKPHIRLTRQALNRDSEVIRVGPNQFARYNEATGADDLICASEQYRVFVRAEDTTANGGNHVASGLKEVRVEYSNDNGATYTPITTLTPTNGIVENFVVFQFPSEGKYRVRFTAEDNAGNTQERHKNVNACIPPANDIALIRQELIDYDNTHYGGAAFFGGAVFNDNPGYLENQGGRGYARVLVDGSGTYDLLNDLVFLVGPHDTGSLILGRDPPDQGDRCNEGEDRIITDDVLDGTALPSRPFWRFRPATRAQRTDRPATPGTYDPNKIYTSPTHYYEFLRAQGRL